MPKAKKPGQRNDLPARAKGSPLAVVGLGLIVVVCFWSLANARFIRSAGRAPGIVTRLNAGGSHPEISFTARSGEVIDYPQGGLIWGYRPGRHVFVLYNPQDPSGSPCLDILPALWFGQGMLLLLGLIFLSVGSYQVFGPKEKAQKAKEAQKAQEKEAM